MVPCLTVLHSVWQLHAVKWLQAFSSGSVEHPPGQEDDGRGGATGRKHPQCLGSGTHQTGMDIRAQRGEERKGMLFYVRS